MLREGPLFSTLIPQPCRPAEPSLLAGARTLSHFRSLSNLLGNPLLAWKMAVLHEENLGKVGVGLCHSPESDELQMSDNLSVSIYYPHQINAYFL